MLILLKEKRERNQSCRPLPHLLPRTHQLLKLMDRQQSIFRTSLLRIPVVNPPLLREDHEDALINKERIHRSLGCKIHFDTSRMFSREKCYNCSSKHTKKKKKGAAKVKKISKQVELSLEWLN